MQSSNLEFKSFNARTTPEVGTVASFSWFYFEGTRWSSHSTKAFFLRLPPTLELGQSHVFCVPSKAALTPKLLLTWASRQRDGWVWVSLPYAWVVDVPADFCAPGHVSHSLSLVPWDTPQAIFTVPKDILFQTEVHVSCYLRCSFLGCVSALLNENHKYRNWGSELWQSIPRYPMFIQI